MNFKDNTWPEIRRINELWMSGRHEYLEKEMRKYLHPLTFPLNNELEYQRGINMLNLLGFSSIFPSPAWSMNDNFIMQEIAKLLDTHRDEYIKLINYSNANKIANRLEQKIVKQMDEFTKIFEFIIPVFGLQFCKKVPEDLPVKKGLITASFEDLKQFYIDSYETAADSVDLLIAYNNLKYRGNFEKMAAKRKDIKSIADFIGKSKGTKLEFIDGKEDFDRLINNYLDNRVRNAIGHNSYEYDGLTQLITFYPRGFEDKSNILRMHLLEFADSCLRLFLCLIDLYGLVYQTKKIYYVRKGYSSINPELIEKYGIFNYEYGNKEIN